MKSALLFAALCLAACSSDDECSTSSLQLELTPVTPCLALSVTDGSSAGAYRIVGTNNCTEDLVVHYPGTHDGGPNDSYPVGASISIELPESEIFNQDTPTKTWRRNAELGTQAIEITVRKPPC